MSAECCIVEPQYDAHLIVGAVDVPNEEKLGVAMLRNSPIELVPGVTGMLKGMGEAVEPGESADSDVVGRERLNGKEPACAQAATTEAISELSRV